jgi:hypothetical protein
MHHEMIRETWLAQRPKCAINATMSRTKKALLLCLALLILASGAAAYSFFIGFPRTFEGRRVHRVTVWSKENLFRPELLYYAYTADGKETKHGIFQRYESGQLVQQATYRNGKVDGPIIYWNLFGEKTQEIYYHEGVPYGWANFRQGKLMDMRQEIMQDGRSVAVRTFDHDRYSLQFKCGELINAVIDPNSGQVSSVPNATRRACIEP